MSMLALSLSLLLCAPARAAEDAPANTDAPATARSFKHSSIGDGHNLKWVRDSIEYQMLTEQIYRSAAESVAEAAVDLGRKTRWAVVLDVDETVLDNSGYQLERAAYGVGFEPPSWYAWCERREADPIPGVADFIANVRDLGGEIVFITNRDEVVRNATRANLKDEGLWEKGDLLCLADENNEPYTKVVRRSEVRSGDGRCSEKKGLKVLAYLGDSITDFPAEGEEEVNWSAQFGERYFLLPNPLYGRWERGVTRQLRRMNRAPQDQ